MAKMKDPASNAVGPTDYQLNVSMPDITGRICITSEQIPGLFIYSTPTQAFSDVPLAVAMLDELNGRRRP